MAKGNSLSSAILLVAVISFIVDNEIPSSTLANPMPPRPMWGSGSGGHANQQRAMADAYRRQVQQLQQLREAQDRRIREEQQRRQAELRRQAQQKRQS
uniref:Uncharacterized protein n=1 Tax=Rhipicephalus appendiculatus TaxID=34631 RepID=A0A131YTI7_RHIAP